MKVLFINDSTTNANWGDRGAAISLMAMVRESGGEIVHAISEDDLWTSTFSASEAGFGEAAKDVARDWVPPALVRARRRLLTRLGDEGPASLIPQRWEDFESAAVTVSHEQRYGWPVVLRAMEDADLALIHGASLHGHGITIIQRTDLFLTYLMKTRFGKAVVIANHTADFDYPVLRPMAEHVYPLFDDVVYRDPISAERWSGEFGGRFAADTAFWFAPAERAAWAALAGRPTYFDVWPDTAAFDPSVPYLCLGGSSVFHDRDAWEPVLQGFGALIRELRSVYQGQIVLTASADLDLPLFRVLGERLGLPVIGVTTPVQQAVDILGNADAYIGGRWHPSIFALRGGCPLIALSSQTFKMRALAGLVGDAATFDALDVGHEAGGIARRLASLLDQGDDVRSHLTAWAAGMAENSWDNVAFLAPGEGRGAGAASRVAP